MLLPLVLAVVGSRAELTSVGPVPGVNQFMSAEVMPVGECLRAKLASIRSLSRVNALVRLQVTVVCERLVAVPTFRQLLLLLRQILMMLLLLLRTVLVLLVLLLLLLLVLLHLLLRFPPLLLLVHAKMPLQLGAVAEHLIALLAREAPLPGVDQLVPAKTGRLREALAAHLANERPLTRVYALVVAQVVVVSEPLQAQRTHGALSARRRMHLVQRQAVVDALGGHLRVRLYALGRGRLLCLLLRLRLLCLLLGCLRQRQHLR